MNLDIRTLDIVVSITNFLQVMVIFLQYRVNKAYQGIGWWVLGFTSMAMGYVFLLLRDLISIKLITIIFANALILLGPTFIYIGIMRFLDKKENRGIVISIFAVFILSFFYYTYFDDDITFRTVIVYAAATTILLLTAQSLVLNKTRSITASAYFNAAVLLSNGCFFAVRTVVALTVDPINSLFTPTMMQTVSFLFIFGEGILLTFGLIIMVNQRLNAEMREAKEHFELIFNTSPDAVLITRLHDGYFVGINEGFTALTGYTRADVIGKSTLEVNIWKKPADRQQVVTALNEKGFCDNLEAVFQRKNGSQFTGMVSARIFALQGRPHIISVTRDITERKRLQEELEKLATTDDLTGISNRRHFLELAHSEIIRAIRLNHPLAIALIDIDYLKQINDTYGHAAGDQVLLTFAKTCQERIREMDVFARLGGDEFALLLPETSCEQVYVAVERLRLALATLPLSLAGKTISITISSGIASLGSKEESLDTFLARADQALYRAKEAGRNRVTVEDALG
ncbi:MAG TPA: diguanylate cyclase [Anaerolineales bacterium]